MSLIITNVFDGPLSGGTPKGVELYVTANIADLSIYGVGSANNGGGSDGEEFTFPAVAATQGDYIYVASDTTGFTSYFGFAPDYTSGSMSINGNDGIELFQNGAVIDLFGDINMDGTGEVWDHVDGWASRVPGAAASPTFAPADWTFSGTNALDGATSNATAATPIPIATFGAPPPMATFTINEIDADQTDTDTAEFIEIYDGGLGGSSLNGLTVVLYNGNGDAAYDTISLDGQTTNAEGFFVIGAAGVANVDLTPAGFTLQNGADAVALYEGTVPAGPSTTNLLDAIVHDTNDADDTGLLTALGLTTQYNEDENGAKDIQSLSRDPDGTGAFVTQAPTPGATNFIAPPVTITKIHDIQGAVGINNLDQVGTDDLSPLAGQTVSIQAIVTADFQDGLFGSMGDLNGFYVQEEEIDYDINDMTSEGIFIFDGSAPAVDVAIGDLVTVTGTVSEFNGETQISATSVVVDSSGNSLPSSTTVTFPTANVMLDDDGNYVAGLEAYEGMLINVPQDMVLTEMFNLDRFGQYNASATRLEQFTQENAPSVSGYTTHLQDVAKSTIVLDDGQTGQNPDPIKVIDGNDGVLSNTDTFSMGDTITGITGVATYAFDEFRVHSATGTYADANPREEAPDPVSGDLKIASLNVLNYFTTIDLTGVTTDNGSDPRGADSAAEFARQADKLVNALKGIDADIVGLVELENDFAGTNFAIKDLVDRVNADLGSTVYGFIDPGQEFVGDDAIANGLIYKVAEVNPIGSAAILTNFNGMNFLDPLGAGRDLNRAAVAQTFEDVGTGQTVTVSVNHFKSKGSLSGLAVDDNQGDGQGNNNATRAAASAILADWLASDPTGQGAAQNVILGDLNAYAKEDPVTTLINAGYTDLADAILGNTAYSYVFDGQTGTLDYALGNNFISPHLAGATEWHINSDEADAFDYNLDFGRNPALFDGSTAARNSDHDPVIVSFVFSGPTPGDDVLAGTVAGDMIALLAGNDLYDGGQGNDNINGQSGDDTLLGNLGEDTIIGGAGNDEMSGGADNDTLNGQTGDDTLNGDDGDDRLYGRAGADNINGGAGSDRANGGDGMDVLSGEAGNDTLRGGAGEDTISGGLDDDQLSGDGEADLINGDNGNDTVNGDAGNDTVSGDDGNDRVNGGSGDDTVLGGAGDDFLLGAAGNDLINGMLDNDTVAAGSGDDTVNGDEGNDFLNGGIGNDLINGGVGDDQIDGSPGDDTITGGAGADTFVLSPRGAATDGDVNVITDLDFAEDELLIRSFGGNPEMTVSSAIDLYFAASGGMSVMAVAGDTVVTFDEDGAVSQFVLQGIDNPFILT